MCACVCIYIYTHTHIHEYKFVYTWQRAWVRDHLLAPSWFTAIFGPFLIRSCWMGLARCKSVPSFLSVFLTLAAVCFVFPVECTVCLGFLAKNTRKWYTGSCTEEKQYGMGPKMAITTWRPMVIVNASFFFTCRRKVVWIYIFFAQKAKGKSKGGVQRVDSGVVRRVGSVFSSLTKLKSTKMPAINVQE